MLQNYTQQDPKQTPWVSTLDNKTFYLLVKVLDVVRNGKLKHKVTHLIEPTLLIRQTFYLLVKVLDIVRNWKLKHKVHI